MDLNDLLADIDGLGGDSFVPSTPSATEQPPAATLAPAADAVAPATQTDQLGMVLDVELALTVELGRARVRLKDLIACAPGDRFALGQSADAPLNIYIDNQLIARGEPLIVEGALAIKILELLPHCSIPGM